MSSSKPNVLICGGLSSSGCRNLAAYLVPIKGERLVNFLRIVDKYSVMPPTTYLGAEFPKVLSQENVEYKQANLTIPAVIASCFDAPAGHSDFDYVIDFTGESRFDRAEQIHISSTFQVARLLGLEAEKRKVKAYVRVTPPTYESTDKGSHDEKEDIKPIDDIGKWMHETLRVLGAMKDLNLVILRNGFLYGPYINQGIYAKFIAVAAVYGYLHEPMPFFYLLPSNPMNTVHIDDLSGAVFACAEWMAGLGRQKADSIAGETIHFHNEKSNVKKVDGMISHDVKVVAPLFNIVDDSHITLEGAAVKITSMFGIKPEFTFDDSKVTGKLAAAATGTFAKLFKFEDKAMEDINEHHVGLWTKMITTSNPPIPNTPLSCYVDKWELQDHKVAYNADKIKKIVGYKLKVPNFNENGEIKAMIEAWKAEGSWPILPSN